MTDTNTDDKLVAMFARREKDLEDYCDQPDDLQVMLPMPAVSMMALRPDTLAGVLIKAQVFHEVVDGELHGGAGPLSEWTMLRSIAGDLQRVPIDDTEALRKVFAALTGGEDPSTNPVVEAELKRRRYWKERGVPNADGTCKPVREPH